MHADGLIWLPEAVGAFFMFSYPEPEAPWLSRWQPTLSSCRIVEGRVHDKGGAKSPVAALGGKLVGVAHQANQVVPVFRQKGAFVAPQSPASRSPIARVSVTQVRCRPGRAFAVPGCVK